MVSTSSLRLTANELESALLLVGHDHRICFANALAHELLGYASGDLQGLPLARLVPPARHAELQNLSAVLAGQAPRRVRSVVTRADGCALDVTMALEPCLDEAGAVEAVSLRYEPWARPTTGVGGLAPNGRSTTELESGIRLDTGRVARLIGEQLGQASVLLMLLEERLVAARKQPVELEHALDVLNEAREILLECELDMSALSPVAELPRPPRLPRA